MSGIHPSHRHHGDQEPEVSPFHERVSFDLSIHVGRGTRMIPGYQLSGSLRDLMYFTECFLSYLFSIIVSEP